MKDILSHSEHAARVQKVLSALEEKIPRKDSIVLLHDLDLLDDVCTLTIERFLRDSRTQRILVLVNRKEQARLVKAWKKRFKNTVYDSMTSSLQEVGSAQICVTNTFDIQVQIGVAGEAMLPFLEGFGVLILYEVPANPSPAWSQIVVLSAPLNIQIVGLSSQLSEADNLLFEQVVDTKE